MERHKVNLGRYILFNNQIDLVLRITLWRNLKGRQVVKMIIPLPRNYPLTAIGTSDIIKSKGLFKAKLFVITSKNTSWYFYPIDLINNLLGIVSKRGIVLDKFFNVAKSENILITPEESFIFNGLGKRFICIGFPYLIRYFNINPEETPIMLQASGGSIRKERDRLRVQQYSQLDRSNIMQIYQNSYPEDFHEMYELFVKYSDLELAEALVSLENNYKLIQYYSTAFGFLPITYISTETVMATLGSTFMYNCGIIRNLNL